MTFLFYQQGRIRRGKLQFQSEVGPLWEQEGRVQALDVLPFLPICEY